MSSLRTSWLAMVLFSSACGAVKGDEEGPDGGVVDTTAPSLVSSSVLNNATKVSVITKVDFVFDEELDAATIDNTIVQLTSFRAITGLAPSERMSGAATWTAATNTLTVAFDRPLAYDTVYQLALPATIKDKAGNAFGGTTLEFSTAANSKTKYVYGTNSGETTYQYSSFTLDADGRVAKEVSFYDPGLDKLWFTADDVAGNVQQTLYVNGQIAQLRTLGAGPDTRLNTSDDVISYMTTYTYDHRRLIEMANFTATGSDGVANTADDGAGPDKQWGTADDQPSSFSMYVWENEQLTREAYFNGRGADNAWHTADDRSGTYYVHAYDALGNKTRSEQRSPGADFLAMTSDDYASSIYDFTYDTRGAAATRARTSTGADRIPGNADDYGSEFHLYLTDARGLVIGDEYWYGWGDDRTWNTPDEPHIYRTENAYDENGLVTRVGYRYAGEDNLLDTADDGAGEHTSYLYNAKGNRTDQRYFYAAGADSTWETGDDLYSEKYEYSAD